MTSSTKTTSGDGHSSTTLVAVAVRGGSSRQAVCWAIDNLIPVADRFVLVHVMPPINSIPTPSGNRIRSSEMDPSIVAMYRQEKKAKCEEIFLPFKTLCRSKEMETLVLEDENPAFAIFKYITTSGCNNLVLGSSSSSKYVGRTLQDQELSATLMNFDTNTCNIFVVSRNKVISKLINSYLPNAEYGDYSEASSVSEVFTGLTSRRSTNGDSFAGETVTYNQAMNRKMSRRNGKKNLLGYPMGKERHDFMASSAFKESNKFELQSELAVLQSELRHTLEMYERACEDLVHVEKKVHSVSSECVDEASKIQAAIEREEKWNKIAEGENAKYLETTKEIEVARKMLEQEVQERQKAELSGAITTFPERQQFLIDALFSGNTGDEIVISIDSFSEAKIIDEGGYGNVYKCAIEKADNFMPSYYFCPILEEVMEDPHIAADGFTYEYSAIQKWVEKQKVSPITRVMLPHIRLIPNLTLRAAIQEWKQQHVQRS